MIKKTILLAAIAVNGLYCTCANQVYRIWRQGRTKLMAPMVIILESEPKQGLTKDPQRQWGYHIGNLWKSRGDKIYLSLEFGVHQKTKSDYENNSLAMSKFGCANVFARCN